MQEATIDENETPEPNKPGRFQRLIKFLSFGQEGYIGVVETIALTCILLGAGFLFFIGDPTFVFAKFTWVWVAPIIIALRYGIALGLLSDLIILVTLFIVHGSQVFSSEYGYYALGFCLLTLVCGQVRSGWAERIRRATLMADFYHQRLENLSRMYYLTRVSHDNLENNLINKPVTLRSALLELRGILIANEGEVTPELANRFIAIVGQVCGIDSLALYMKSGDKISTSAVASLGEVKELDEDDLLVKEVMKTKKILHASVNRLGEHEYSRYLAVAPLRTSEGGFQGLLCLAEMSFMTLNEQNLRSLSVLMSYFADDVTAVHHSKALLKIYPDCPVRLAAELYRLVLLFKEVEIESSLIAVVVKKQEEYSTIIDGLEAQKRGLDFNWRLEYKGFDVFMTLMPISTAFGMEGYIKRIKVWLKAERGLEFKAGEIFTRYTQLYDAEPPIIIERLLKQIA